MKKILFDFLPFEDKIINGGALYAKTILIKLLEKDIQLVGICNRKEELNFEILDLVKDNKIEVLEFSKDWIQKINTAEFECFFIGIAQRYNSIDLSDLECKIFIVCHDLVDICVYKAGLSYNYETYYNLFKLSRVKFPKLRCYFMMLKKMIKEKSILGFSLKGKKLLNRMHYRNLSKLLSKENVFLLTDSQYSKNALEYYFENIKNPISVFYAPIVVREYNVDNVSDNIKQLVLDKKYFLFLSADRYTKNIAVFLEQFEKFQTKTKGEYQAIVVGLSDFNHKDIFCLEKVNDSELEYLLEHAYCLVYASLGEGFGYPPLEAMSKGVPVIASYNTSIPEVCGNELLYFNPSYQEDLYCKEMMLINAYKKFVDISLKISSVVNAKQIADLDKLIEFITNR